MIHFRLKSFVAGAMLMAAPALFSQIAVRERPAEWSRLVTGGRFMDRFLPMKGKVLSSDTWGVQGVRPRFIDNGIENSQWSFWGGNIIRSDNGKYHMFVCGWLEGSPQGHAEWPRSLVFNAVSDSLYGPFRPRNLVGSGHNPEVFRLKDGRYVLYVIDGRYVADTPDAKWEFGRFEFNARDRRIIEGLSNLSFTQREDGSFLMVCRGGGIWISRDGLSEYSQITDKRVYPDVDGRFEDPVIWRDSVQYHLIVNDWLGRVAFYLRSKDGIQWVTDPGEAYTPGIAVHEDGRVEDWFKFERLKIFQDRYGRAIQANFAVIDTLKPLDKPFDNHSSKNISIPLNPGLRFSILGSAPVTEATKRIIIKIQAEEGFNPHTDIDIASLRFGASDKVNFGGGSKVLLSEKEGADLIVTFEGKGSGLTIGEFAPKLLGRYSNGKMLFGYARQPGVSFQEPLLSARAPMFRHEGAGLLCSVEVQNFGLTASSEVTLKVELIQEGKRVPIATATVIPLEPYAKTQLQMPVNYRFVAGTAYNFEVSVMSGKKVLSTFSLTKKAIEN